MNCSVFFMKYDTRSHTLTNKNDLCATGGNIPSYLPAIINTNIKFAASDR